LKLFTTLKAILLPETVGSCEPFQSLKLKGILEKRQQTTDKYPKQKDKRKIKIITKLLLWDSLNKD
jgi:hypothetical protein